MYSEVIPWEEFINAVADDTGISDLSNREDTIRRSVYRTARDIGFGASLVLYKKTYQIQNDAGDVRIRLPEGIIRIEEIGTCAVGFCPNTYRVQGNYLFICSEEVKSRGEFTLFYYKMFTDTDGRPVILSNHYEAILAGVALQLYKPKRFVSEGNANQYALMAQEYDQRVGEARGSDVMPTTFEEWQEIANIINMSRREYFIYNMRHGNYCCAAIDETDPIIDIPDPVDPPTPTAVLLHYWQLIGATDDINLASGWDQNYIDQQESTNINNFSSLRFVEYSEFGRNAFAIQSTEENAWNIYDAFGQNITEEAFDTFYNPTLEVQFYVSKNPIIPSQIQFRFSQT